MTLGWLQKLAEGVVRHEGRRVAGGRGVVAVIGAYACLIPVNKCDCRQCDAGGYTIQARLHRLPWLTGNQGG